MPKEQIRKRGKRRPKGEQADDTGIGHDAQPPATAVEDAFVVDTQGSAAGPSGIHPARAAMLSGRPIPPGQLQEMESEGGVEAQNDWTRGPRVDSEFPFGVLDPDVKAYFRSVEEQIRDWEGVSSVGEEREDRQLFLTSVLSELRSHELPTATDPETSIVLERLLPSLNDWGRRVIGDAFGDKWGEMFRHRFGSHVAQTWMTLAADTLDREARGIWPAQQKNQDESVGKLPTMTELFADIITSLLPTLPTLLSSPHASPPIRLLLLVLTPNRSLPTLDGGDKSGLIRSKRSGNFRSNQGVKGKSILGEGVDEGKGKEKEINRQVPKELVRLRRQIREELMAKLGAAEWKAMGVDAVGSATVQLLLELEVEDGEAEQEGSLFDILTEGLITQLKNTSSASHESQPYLLSLLASQTGTRLFETLLLLSPENIFDNLWSTYFEKKLGRLAGHPFANFVAAKGVSRLHKTQIEGLIAEVRGNAGGRGLIKAARTSVLQALVERAVILADCQKAVLDLICSTLELPPNERNFLVPCLMALKTLPAYQAILNGAPEEEEPTQDAAAPTDAVDAEAEKEAAAKARYTAWQNRRTAKPKAAQGEVEVNMQGCLILQGMMGLGEINPVVLDSLFAQPNDTLLGWAKHPIASHLLDVVFINAAVPPKYRRKLMMAFLGHYEVLVDDKLGSRVVDTVWDRADGFMKEKIARSLIPHLTDLGNSQYGKYFVRKAEVGLLHRRPDEWRERIVGVKHHFAHQKAAPTQSVTTNINALTQEGGKKRRNDAEDAEKEDEIDVLFSGVKDKKRKKDKMMA